MTKIFPTENDMQVFASQFARVIADGTVIFLSGPLGAGKTTFTRGFLRGLGYASKVKSPTYTIVEPYDINGRSIFHFDFYRLNDPNELELIGIQDYFHASSICLIEWPEKGFPLLPEPDLICEIAFSEQGRTMRIVANSEQGQQALLQLR